MTKKSKEAEQEIEEQPAAEETAEDAAEEVAPLSEEEKLQQEVVELRDEALRAKAELENSRKRLQKQKIEEVKYASLPLMRDLLSVMDNLELALKYAKEDDPLREGVGMALDGMKKVLEQSHLKPIITKGEKFDPSLHEAVSMIADLSAEDGIIIEEHRIGYKLHDRVVRASAVIVNRLPEEKEESKEE